MQYEIVPPTNKPTWPTVADMEDGQWGIIRDSNCFANGWLVRCTRADNDDQQGWHCFSPENEHIVFKATDWHHVEILKPGTKIIITL